MSKLVLAFFAACLISQCADELPSTPERRVVEVKNLKGERLRRATAIVSAFLHPGDAKEDESLGVVLLRGSESALPAAERLLHRLDVPSTTRPDAQIQFTIYLVEAGQDETPGSPIPQPIAGAVEQMRKTFAYKNYRVLDTIPLQTKNGGSADVRSLLRSDQSAAGYPTQYDLSIGNADILEDGKSVAVSKFHFHVRLPFVVATGGNSIQFQDAGLNTNLTVQRGQKLVLGKVSSDQVRSAIFLIITTDF